MFNTNSILETLRSGSLSAEEIAQSFADALNEANATYLAEQETAKAAATKEAEKLSSLQPILGSFNSWYDTYYEGSSHFSAEDVIKILDSVQKFSSCLETWSDGLHTTIENVNGKISKKSEKIDEKPRQQTPVSDSKRRVKKNPSIEDAFDDFFKEFGL